MFYKLYKSIYHKYYWKYIQYCRNYIYCQLFNNFKNIVVYVDLNLILKNLVLFNNIFAQNCVQLNFIIESFEKKQIVLLQFFNLLKISNPEHSLTFTVLISWPTTVLQCHAVLHSSRNKSNNNDTSRTPTTYLPKGTHLQYTTNTSQQLSERRCLLPSNLLNYVPCNSRKRKIYKKKLPTGATFMNVLQQKTQKDVERLDGVPFGIFWMHLCADKFLCVCVCVYWLLHLDCCAKWHLLFCAILLLPSVI